MKDADDWDFILNADALFYSLALGIGARADMNLADCHEGLWTSFEQGQFKLKPGDGDVPGRQRSRPPRYIRTSRWPITGIACAAICRRAS